MLHRSMFPVEMGESRTRPDTQIIGVGSCKALCSAKRLTLVAKSAVVFWLNRVSRNKPLIFAPEW